MTIDTDWAEEWEREKAEEAADELRKAEPPPAISGTSFSRGARPARAT